MATSCSGSRPGEPSAGSGGPFAWRASSGEFGICTGCAASIRRPKTLRKTAITTAKTMTGMTTPRTMTFQPSTELLNPRSNSSAAGTRLRNSCTDTVPASPGGGNGSSCPRRELRWCLHELVREAGDVVLKFCRVGRLWRRGGRIIMGIM